MASHIDPIADQFDRLAHRELGGTSISLSDDSHHALFDGIETSRYFNTHRILTAIIASADSESRLRHTERFFQLAAAYEWTFAEAYLKHGHEAAERSATRNERLFRALRDTWRRFPEASNRFKSAIVEFVQSSEQTAIPPSFAILSDRILEQYVKFKRARWPAAKEHAKDGTYADAFLIRITRRVLDRRELDLLANGTADSVRRFRFKMGPQRLG